MRSTFSFFSFYGRSRRMVYGLFSLAMIPVFGLFITAAPIAVLR